MRQEIVQPLLEWYNGEKRDLPWRDKHNAYYTWVSEIMLQQTRVEAVKPYFARFIEMLPDLSDLAACSEDQLLKLWEGLGYYSRVRNMQIAARQVMELYEGKLPESYAKLLELKGIGEYTAAAIASIAYGIAVPAVDGNVLRVVTRLMEDPEDIMKASMKKRIQKELMEIIPEDAPGDFNQAMMELGAVVCVPNGAPRCEACPIRIYCLAKKHGTAENFPVKAPKKARTIENRTVLVIQDADGTAIRRRPPKGLLAGLYELPSVEGHLTEEETLAYVETLDLEPLHIRRLPEAKHIFSHIEWRMTGYQIRVSSLEKSRTHEILFAGKRETQEKYAIPSAFKAYIKYMKEDLI